jgi:hypothetical protein
MGVDAARVTREAHLGELVRDRELAIAHGQISAAVQAEHLRGKAAGLYEKRSRILDGPDDAELINAIKQLFGRAFAG